MKLNSMMTQLPICKHLKLGKGKNKVKQILSKLIFYVTLQII